MDQKRVYQYFGGYSGGKKKLGIFIIILSFFVCPIISESATEAGNDVAVMIDMIILLACLVFAIRLIIKEKKERPDSSLIDRVCTEMVKEIPTLGLKKLALTQERVSEMNPIMFVGSCFDDIGRSIDYIQIDKNGQFRSTNYQAVIFYFSKNMIHCYTRYFSVYYPGEFAEFTSEYSYQQINSINMKTAEKITKKKGKTGTFKVKYTELVISTISEAIVINLTNADAYQEDIVKLKNLIYTKTQS